MIDLKKLWEAMPPDVQRKISCHDLKRIVDNYNGPESPDLITPDKFKGSSKTWWEKSEWPHPKFPKSHWGAGPLPDVIWIRFHRVFRGDCFEDDVTGWQSTYPKGGPGSDSQNAGVLAHADEKTL